MDRITETVAELLVCSGNALAFLTEVESLLAKEYVEYCRDDFDGMYLDAYFAKEQQHWENAIEESRRVFGNAETEQAVDRLNNKLIKADPDSLKALQQHFNKKR